MLIKQIIRKFNMTFLFDILCDDIIILITQYIVWAKDPRCEIAGTQPAWANLQRILILPLERPIITLESRGWWLSPNWRGPVFEAKREIIKNKIRKNKKGLISYTHKWGQFKQISAS